MLGLPSRSPPIHDPNRIGATSRGSGVPVVAASARSTARRYCGSASQRLCSNTTSPARTSSSGAHARAAHFVGLPGGRNLPLKIGERLFLLVRRQVGPIAKRQNLRDAIVFLQQRAAHDLGGMRREDQLDPHRGDGGGQRVGGDTALAQSREGLGGRSALRPPVRIARMIAPAMHAMVLLGDVGQRQEMRERAGHGQRRGHRHVAQQPIDVLELAVERARPLGRLAHLLDLLEDLVAFVMPQHAAEHLAEQAHVVSQRLVRIDTHLRDPISRLTQTD